LGQEAALVGTSIFVGRTRGGALWLPGTIDNSRLTVGKGPTCSEKPNECWEWGRTMYSGVGKVRGRAGEKGESTQ